jgi:hypothetical protein
MSFVQENFLWIVLLMFIYPLVWHLGHEVSDLIIWGLYGFPCKNCGGKGIVSTQEGFKPCPKCGGLSK